MSVAIYRSGALSLEQGQEWDAAVRRCLSWDVYHLAGYHRIAAGTDGGEPRLFRYESGQFSACLPYLKRTVAFEGVDDTGCFDELLLKDFDALLADRERDHLIVLHQRGSHGPAYNTDVPQWAKEFLPECDLPNLRNCDRDAINNSYDNTILYTDHVVAQLIAMLREAQAQVDGALLYASDHGESLGEHGLYLHGMPYALAPRVQKEVPMLLWTSPAYDARVGLDAACIARRATLGGFSHDNVYHTLLGAAGVRNGVYQSSLDIFSGCTAQGPHT